MNKDSKNKKEESKKISKNKTTLPEFINICKKTQKELKNFLVSKLKEEGYQEIVSEDGFLYAKGTEPVLLTAHLDTVHKKRIKTFYEAIDSEGVRTVYSPEGIGGDDRCGVFMILQLIKEHKCSVLFCEDEEVGGVGSDKFIKTKFLEDLKELNYMIELDRKGKKDAVFYFCDNDEFLEFVTENTGYKEDWGSFSDISVLAPVAGIAAVNLSCGYYNAHTTSEYVVLEHMFDTIIAVKRMLNAEGQKQFEYIESYYSGYVERDYCEEIGLYATFKQGNEIKEEIIYGVDEGDVWMNFFMGNPEICFNDILDYAYDYFSSTCFCNKKKSEKKIKKKGVV